MTVSLVKPRLTVVVVVDQLRGDEIDLLRPQWRAGFRTLIQEGIVYAKAVHTHGYTETASGHATIATGVLPSEHGVLDKNLWVGQRQGEAWGHMGTVCDFTSGANPPACDAGALLVPTLGDRLKARSEASRVVAVAAKARSANMLGGKNADLVAWFTADGPARPLSRKGAEAHQPTWLKDFERNPLDKDLVWDLSSIAEGLVPWPPSRHRGREAHLGVGFPHRREANLSRSQHMAAWLCTPESDEAVVDMALLAVEKMQLGRGPDTDLLWISLAATDLVGHMFGSMSLERAAILRGVDDALGRLLEGLMAAIDPSQLFVALTADHGVMPQVDDAIADGHDAGHLMVADVQDLANAGMRTWSGYEARAEVKSPFVFVHEPDPRLRAQMAAGVAKQIKTHPRVYNAWTVEELNRDKDPIAQLMCKSWHPLRGGDVVFTPNEFSKLTFVGEEDEAGEHGTPWLYDRHVPAILWGQGRQSLRDEAEMPIVDFMKLIAAAMHLPKDD